MQPPPGSTIDESSSSGVALEQLYTALIAALAAQQQAPTSSVNGSAVRLPRSVLVRVVLHIRRHFAPPSWQSSDVAEQVRGACIGCVDEFKLLMWEAVAACFPNDSTLTLAIRTLTRQPELLARLVHPNVIGEGCYDHPANVGSNNNSSSRPPSHREMATSPTPPFGATPAQPHSPFGVGPFGATPTTAEFLASFRADSVDLAGSAPGANSSSLTTRGPLGASTTLNVSSRRRPNLSTSPNPNAVAGSGRAKAVAASPLIKQRYIPSRRVILVSLMMLVTISLFTSLHLWDRSHVSTFSPPKQSVVVGGHLRQLDKRGQLITATDLPTTAAPPPLVPNTVIPNPSPLAVKPRSSLDKPAIPQAPPTQHPVKPAPPVEAPRVHPFCGADSALHASGLPGPSSQPVDSIVAMAFDLTDEEQQNAKELGGAYVLELIASAMATDPTVQSSPYHAFFRERNVSLEVADMSDEATEALERVGKGGPLRTTQVTRRTPQCRGVRPLKMDVVYTYVNPQSPSHKASVSACTKGRNHVECADARFRDYDELRYSMRSVFHRAMCPQMHHTRSPSPPATAATNHTASAVNASMSTSSATTTTVCTNADVSFVDKVHVIVAHNDQIPTWLNQSDPRIRVVTHKMIFPPEDHQTALPTFNSYAIESVMHRVPELSRYFAYFNNDMLWGRHLSFFDYFRPLSTARQAYRLRTSPEAQCFARHYATDNKGRDGMPPSGLESSGGDDEQRRWQRKRTVVLFEPIYYFEKLDQVLDRQLLNKRQHPLSPGLQRAGSFDLTNTSSPFCTNVPFKASSVVALRMKTPTAFNVLHMTTNFNRNVLFEHYGMPPSHGFAHYPTIVDRDVLRRMQEVEIPALSAQTRRSRFRQSSNVWTTYVYPYVALAHRRAVDKDLAIELGLWQRSTEESQLTGIAAVGPLMDPSFEALPSALQGNLWLSSGNFDNEMGKKDRRLLKEKLQNWVVAMDGKDEPIYHFCMMTSPLVLQRYIRELQTKMKLFVTLNDDLKLINQHALSLVQHLLHLVTANQPKAKWELS